MPWEAGDAARHDKGAKTAKQKRQWAHVANSTLAKTGDEGRAVRAANSVVGPRRKPKDKKVRHRKNSFTVRDRSRT